MLERQQQRQHEELMDTNNLKSFVVQRCQLDDKTQPNMADILRQHDDAFSRDRKRRASADADNFTQPHSKRLYHTDNVISDVMKGSADSNGVPTDGIRISKLVARDLNGNTKSLQKQQQERRDAQPSQVRSSAVASHSTTLAQQSSPQRASDISTKPADGTQPVFKNPAQQLVTPVS